MTPDLGKDAKKMTNDDNSRLPATIRFRSMKIIDKGGLRGLSSQPDPQGRK
jgi:hypothetical protein